MSIRIDREPRTHRSDWPSESFVHDEPNRRDDLLLILASGPEDNGKRATLAMSTACTALALGRRTRLFLVGDGAHWAYKRQPTAPALPTFPPLERLFAEFVELDGEIHLCSACESVCTAEAFADLREGIEISGFAAVLAEHGGGSCMCF